MIRMGALLWNGLESSFFFLFSTTFVQSFGFLDLSLGIFLGMGANAGKAKNCFMSELFYWEKLVWLGLVRTGPGLWLEGFLKIASWLFHYLISVIIQPSFSFLPLDVLCSILSSILCHSCLDFSRFFLGSLFLFLFVRLYKKNAVVHRWRWI